MKFYLTILITLFITFCSFGQSKDESIAQIKSHFQYINSQTNYTISELNNEDLFDQMPDNGAQLKGFYKNDTIYKIIDWTGISYAVFITEYYFWKDKLIFVYNTESDYKQTYDSSGQFSGFDYSGTELKYEVRHYYKNEKEIKKIENGKQLMKNDSTLNYIEEARILKDLLKNKKDNQDSYDKIQGKWQSTIDSLSTIEFYGLTRIDYYNGKYVDKSKIKIDKNRLLSNSTKDDDLTLEYEIMALSDNSLTLMYLVRGNLLTYTKKR